MGRPPDPSQLGPRASQKVAKNEAARRVLDDQLTSLPDGTYRQTTPDQTVSQFNLAHRIASTTDRNGNVWRFDYDASGSVIIVLKPTNQSPRRSPPAHHRKL